MLGPKLYFRILLFGIQVLNMLCCWVDDPDSEAFKLHLPRISDYLWIAEDGMKCQVCNYLMKKILSKVLSVFSLIITMIIGV